MLGARRLWRGFCTSVAEDDSNFIVKMIKRDLAQRDPFQIVTRFPPEPNGLLHLGHAKSICLNFGLAERFKGVCNLRMDNSNPLTEVKENVDAIVRDVKWLGFEGPFMQASDHFERFYLYAEQLIQQGDAFVCDLTREEIRTTRGNFTRLGENSPFRKRSIEENLDLFRRMRKGEFKDNACTLRAKIDMGSPNIVMRDPILYRIRHAHHYATGDAWCIYPTYDFVHCLTDAVEGITHSLCSMEFEQNRALYDWILDRCGITHGLVDPSAPRPRQTEFSRLNLENTIMSKRLLTKLVQEKLVSGWDDPRLPTLVGLKRRGYTPSSIRSFCATIGVSRELNNKVELSVLEHCIREELNVSAPRVMCVLKPLVVRIVNWPAGKVQEIEVQNHPNAVEMGTRIIPMDGVILIDKSDFRMDPDKQFKRLVLGGEVRLRHSYVIRCVDVVREGDEIVELRCEYDPLTFRTNPTDRKVAGVIHWVSQAQSVKVEARLYSELLKGEGIVESSDNDDDQALAAEPQQQQSEVTWMNNLNPNSLELVQSCALEPWVAKHSAQFSAWQFEREGYFVQDSEDSKAPNSLVFNRVVALRQSSEHRSQQPQQQQKKQKKQKK